jgi:dipeptidyl aminopeptidase/acylaminoacyl peptidase
MSEWISFSRTSGHPSAKWPVGILALLVAGLVIIPSFVASEGHRESVAAKSFEVPLPDIETFMQIGYASEPRISEDGSVIYFTSGLTGASQVFRFLPNGWPYQLTVFEDGVDYYTSTRDGKWLIVGAGVGGNERTQFYLMDGETGALRRLTDKPEARYLTPFWHDDDRTIFYASNEVNGRDFHMYRWELPDGEPVSILEAEGYNIPMDLDATGKRLLFLRVYSNVNHDLLILDLESGDIENLTEHEGEIRYRGGEYTADERGVYTITNNNDRGLLKPAVLDMETRELSFPYGADSPWELEDFAISPSKRFGALVFNEEGYGNLTLVDLERSEELPTPPLEGIVSNLSVSDNNEVVFSYNSPTQPPDVWLWNWETSELRQISHSTTAGIDVSQFAQPKLIRYETFDGMEIPAFLYLPRDYAGGAIPFIMDIHGGPEGQFRPYFNRHFNYLLLHGFGLLAPNIRGSSGYGKEYIQMDNYKKRMDSVRDVGAAAQWLIDNGYTTPEQLGIKGGSYGGYMTLAALTHFPDLFAAGCDQVGIANFETFLKNTADYRRAIREAEYGPLSDPEFLREISPITHVDRIKAALMVVHGENDPRVPVSEARQIAKAVAARGAVVDTLIFPDEGHGLAKRENRLVYYRKMVDFFKKTLQGVAEGS